MSDNRSPEIVDVNREALFSRVVAVNIAVRLATTARATFGDVGNLCLAVRALNSRISYSTSTQDRRKVVDSMRRVLDALSFWSQVESEIQPALERGVKLLQRLLPSPQRWGEAEARAAAIEIEQFFAELYDHIAPRL